MKTKTALLVLFMFVVSTCFAQSKAGAGSWKELKEFHEVMAATYHPRQENDLKPIKARATELKEKAMALSNSKVPAEFNNDKIKASVAKLQEECTMMEKMVKNNSTDKEITKYLAQVHDTFHTIVGLCSHDEEHEEHGKESK